LDDGNEEILEGIAHFPAGIRGRKSMPIRLRRRISAPTSAAEELLRLAPDDSPEAPDAAAKAGDVAATEPTLTPPFLSLRASAGWLSISMATLKRLAW
jgi:hypothetical protein